jgi:multicomponent Na+:H+ antiporter subunit D
LYGAFGALDIDHLSREMDSSPMTLLAFTLMISGMSLKSGLFPLHFWLPAAHANALAPVSAILSGLVIKGTFYLFLRFSFEVFPSVLTPQASELVGILGAFAIIWGSIQAIAQTRLKMLLAYSTVAQVGYLFLLVPMAGSPQAWSGVVYHAVSHGFAKASLFLASGLILHAVGTDELSQLKGVAKRLPSTALVFAFAGISLMSLPPSGGFLSKWLMMNAAFETGQWWWAIVLTIGGLLSAVYVGQVISIFFRKPQGQFKHEQNSFLLNGVAMALALVALGLGFRAIEPIRLIQIGMPFGVLFEIGL